MIIILVIAEMEVNFTYKENGTTIREVDFDFN